MNPRGNELFEKNLAFFRDAAPSLYDIIKGVSETVSTLVEVGDDDWDVDFRGVRLYECGAKEAARRQMDEEARWSRFFTTRPSATSVDERAGAFLTGMLGRAEDEDIGFSEVMSSSEGYYLVVFGIGLAQHLPELLKTTKCRKMILVEPNKELLYHSMSVFDWRVFVEESNEAGVALYWLPVSRDIQIATEIRVIIRCANSTRVDGMWLYTHYYNKSMHSALNLFKSEAGVLLSGLGWLDDEILMIKNSHANLKGGQARVFTRRDRHYDWPVFIVGSGPSIDADLDHIAANAPKAIVIACGTGLGPLLRRGIRPDFYVELENLPQSYQFLENITQNYSIEGITLVATTTIDPRIAPMFDQAIWFMRDGLASFPVFCRDPATEVPHINPTVSNTGLGFALAAGFHEFYFFGIDLGSKDPKNHHSKETPYMKGVLPYDVVMDKTLPANFGGEVYTDSVFNWAHDSYQKVLAIQCQGNQFYNCSNGALIKGATPKIARTLNLPERGEASGDVVARLLADCRPYGEAEFHQAWNVEAHFAEVSKFRDDLLALCEAETPEHPLDYIDRMIAYLHPNHKTKASHHYYRGSLALAMISANYFYNRTPDDKRERMQTIIREEFVKMINGTNDRIISHLAYLAEPAEEGAQP